jgi:ABC-2 type transport system ATP-binding protein
MVPLEVIGLTRRFGRVEALRGISFSVEPGEVFGYLGPNGAGKSTTLRILMGLVRPDLGQARILGGAPGADLSRVGYLPGELHLYGDMTARGLLDYVAGFRPRRRPRLRDELCAALALDAGTLERRIKTLSHGTKQKVGLILALQHDPDLWLLDEPTGGLDPLVQQGFRGIVLDGAARGRAVLLSSHVLSEVEAVAGRVGILRAGELVAVETIDTLRARTVRRLEVRFAGPAPAGLATTPGVVDAAIDGPRAVLRVRGDVNPILRLLAATGVEELVFPEAELEDIFLGFYQRGAAEGSDA